VKKKIEDMFIRFDTIHERDVRTHSHCKRLRPCLMLSRAKSK